MLLYWGISDGVNLMLILCHNGASEEIRGEIMRSANSLPLFFFLFNPQMAT